MDGFFYQIEEFHIDRLPGLTFSGWLEVDHDAQDGWFVSNVWLDNGMRNVACPTEVSDAIKTQVHDDDEMMSDLATEGRAHNEV